MCAIKKFKHNVRHCVPYHREGCVPLMPSCQFTSFLARCWETTHFGHKLPSSIHPCLKGDLVGGNYYLRSRRNIEGRTLVLHKCSRKLGAWWIRPIDYWLVYGVFGVSSKWFRKDELKMKYFILTVNINFKYAFYWNKCTWEIGRNINPKICLII